jgi:hypothetical protein
MGTDRTRLSPGKRATEHLRMIAAHPEGMTRAQIEHKSALSQHYIMELNTKLRECGLMHYKPRGRTWHASKLEGMAEAGQQANRAADAGGTAINCGGQVRTRRPARSPLVPTGEQQSAAAAVPSTLHTFTDLVRANNWPPGWQPQPFEQTSPALHAQRMANLQKGRAK